MKTFILFFTIASAAFGAPTVITVSTLSQPAQVILPSGFDSSKTYQLIIWCHGAGQDYTAPLSDPFAKVMATNIVESQRIICSSTAHGENWGIQAAVDDYTELNNFMMTNAAWHIITNRTVIIPESMGGLCGLQLAANRTGVNTNILGWFGIIPVCNLSNLYSIGTYTAEINTAYGISGNYDVKTAGHDPHLFSASVFSGLRMRFNASPSDTVVPKAFNTDLMQALIAPVTFEDTVVVSSGNHGDASQFQTDDVISFLNRVRSPGPFPAKR
jgi:hypothetical protein